MLGLDLPQPLHLSSFVTQRFYPGRETSQEDQMLLLSVTPTCRAGMSLREKRAVGFTSSPGVVVHSFYPRGEAALKDHELCKYT